MEQKRKSFIKRIKFYVKLGVLAATPIVLTSCNEETNITPTPTTTIETVTPTEEPTVTPTEVVTPTPTEVPTPTPTPYIDPKERHINIEDIMIYENVVGDFFGPEEDFDTEFNKRLDLLNSKHATSETRARNLLIYLNMYKLTDPNFDSAVAEKYFLSCNDNALRETTETLYDIAEYNSAHPEDQIVLSNYAIGDALTLEERAALNSVQYSTHKVKDISYIYASELKPKENYSFRLKDKDNKLVTELKNSCNDYTNVCKYFILAIPYKTIQKIHNEYGSKEVVYNTYNSVIGCYENMFIRLSDIDKVRTKANSFSPNEIIEIDPNKFEY